MSVSATVSLRGHIVRTECIESITPIYEHGRFSPQTNESGHKFTVYTTSGREYRFDTSKEYTTYEDLERYRQELIRTVFPDHSHELLCDHITVGIDYVLDGVETQKEPDKTVEPFRVDFV